MALNETQVVIDEGGRGLPGFLHRPVGRGSGSSASRRGCIVFCHPILEEKKSAHGVLVEAARALAGAGYCVLRFDYGGCGDSPGELRDATVSGWLADIRAAISFAIQECPDGELGLLGLRLGGALALRAAQEEPKVRFAVLWEPVTRGADYLAMDLRKKQINEMLMFGRSRESSESVKSKIASDSDVDFDGHVVSPQLFRDITAIDLTNEIKSFRGRLLITEVSAREKPTPSVLALEAACKRAGAESEVRVIRGAPFWRLLDHADCSELIASMTEWLNRG